MSKIFGIGWAKTGTKTLGECFKILGFNHQGPRLDLVYDIDRGNLARIIALANGKETFEDWPWIILYRELDKAFPDSRFVLTKRAPERWIRSYQNMLVGQGPASKELNKIRRVLYGLPFPNVTKEELIERYTRHNEEVIDFFQDRPQSLLVVDWENGDGWKELCGFLSREIPREPFPHANKGNYAKLDKDFRRDTAAGSGSHQTAAGKGVMTKSTMLLETYLKRLRLPTFIQNYAKFAEDAAQKGLGYDRFLLALAEQEVLEREEKLRQKTRQRDAQ